MGCVRRCRRLQASARRSRLGTRRPAGDQCQLGRCQALSRLAVAEDRTEVPACPARPSGNMRRGREPSRSSGGAGTSAPAARSATAAAARPTSRLLPQDRSGRTASDCTIRSGNAAEWVEDCWNDNYRNAPKDAVALDLRRLSPARAARRQFHQQAEPTSAPRPGSATTPTFVITPTASGCFGNCSDPGAHDPERLQAFRTR